MTGRDGSGSEEQGSADDDIAEVEEYMGSHLGWVSSKKLPGDKLYTTRFNIQDAPATYDRFTKGPDPEVNDFFRQRFPEAEVESVVLESIDPDGSVEKQYVVRSTNRITGPDGSGDVAVVPQKLAAAFSDLCL